MSAPDTMHSVLLEVDIDILGADGFPTAEGVQLRVQYLNSNVSGLRELVREYMLAHFNDVRIPSVTFRVAPFYRLTAPNVGPVPNSERISLLEVSHLLSDRVANGEAHPGEYIEPVDRHLSSVFGTGR